MSLKFYCFINLIMKENLTVGFLKVRVTSMMKNYDLSKNDAESLVNWLHANWIFVMSVETLLPEMILRKDT